MERGLRLPRGKWGWLQLPSAGTGTPIRTPPTAWGKCNDFSVNILDDGVRLDVTAENISRALKSAAAELQYPTTKGIPIDRINTHSLRSGGANALALAGYSDTQIQKMGRWQGATFKEYIRKELACYATGMSKDMKRSLILLT